MKMALSRKTQTILLLITLIAILTFMYFRYLQRPVMNFFPQTISIENLNESRLIELNKKKEQKGIYAIDIEITGYSNRTIMIMIGDEPDRFLKSVTLKKGNFNFAYETDWYSDECYVFIPSEPGAKANIEINYRFLGL